MDTLWYRCVIGVYCSTATRRYKCYLVYKCTYLTRAVTNTQNDRLYMYVIRGICLKAVVAILVVWNQLELWWWLQSLLIDQSLLWSSSKRVGVRVNTHVYIKMLTEKMLPWITESFGKRYVFTQDGVLSHTSNLTQQWCKDHLSVFRDKNIRPISSPDIDQMDFAIWSILNPTHS